MKRKVSKTDLELFLTDVSKHLKEHCGISLRELFLLNLLVIAVLTLLSLKSGFKWYEITLGWFTIVIFGDIIFYLISIFRSTGD
jgi:hypothetical protein